MFLTVVIESVRFLCQYLLDKLQGRPLVGHLNRKCVFITGCDSGFGNALAKKLDSMGVPVYAGCFTEDGAHDLMQETTTRLKIVHVDVSNTESIEKAHEFVRNSMTNDQELWGVVNNAGINLGSGPCEFENRQTFQTCFNINVFGVAEVCRLFLPSLKKSSGRIVNISSVAGRVSGADICVYGSSKFAVEGYSDSLRRDLEPWGVSVHLLEPWFYATGLLGSEEARRTEKWNRQSEDIREQYGNEWFENTLKRYTNFIKTMSIPNINEVIDAYIHALYRKYPKSRYIVGAPSRKTLLIGMLPDFISDKLFCKSMDHLPKAMKRD